MTLAAALGLALTAASGGAAAHDRTSAVRQNGPAATEMSAQARRNRRSVTRLRVERYQRLPPTAVRTCEAWYAQDYRPSGTVIVPKMSCRWISG